MKTKSLDDIFMDEVQKVVQSKPFLVEMVRRHFEKAGLVLTPEQVKTIENQLRHRAKITYPIGWVRGAIV